MRWSATSSIVLSVSAALLLLCAAPVHCLRCVSCTLNDRSDCANGTLAAQNEQLVVTCQESKPYCQVTQQESLLPDGSTVLLEIVRSCAAEQEFRCTNRTGVPLRQCYSTCFHDLCNVYNDGADRVRNPDQHRDTREDGGALAWYWWLVMALAAVALVVAAVVAVVRLKRQHSRLPVYHG